MHDFKLHQLRHGKLRTFNLMISNYQQEITSLISSMKSHLMEKVIPVEINCELIPWPIRNSLRGSDFSLADVMMVKAHRQTWGKASTGSWSGE